MTTPTPYPRALLANHFPYIHAVAAEIERAGLKVTETTTTTTQRREGDITIPGGRDDDPVILRWDEHNGWYWGYAWDDDEEWLSEGDDLFVQKDDPPVMVVAALLESCIELHRIIRAEVPDDLDSALAAYAPKVEPEPDPADPRQIADRLRRDAGALQRRREGRDQATAHQLTLQAYTLHTAADRIAPHTDPAITAEVEALAAQLDPPGPRPGQEVTDRDDDVWMYIDTGADGLRLIDPDLIAHVWTREELDEAYGPLEPVRDVEDVHLPAEEADR